MAPSFAARAVRAVATPRVRGADHRGARRPPAAAERVSRAGSAARRARGGARRPRAARASRRSPIRASRTLRSVMLEPLGDRRVRAALGDQLEHLALARRQRARAVLVARAREQAARRPAGRAPSRPRRRARACATNSSTSVDAVLEEVAEPFGSSASSARRDAGLDVLRQDQDPDAGMARADLVGGAQAFVGVGRRHPDVDDRDVGPVRVDLARAARPASHAWAATSIPARVSIDAIPSRTMTLSSAITTRTAAPRSRRSRRRAGWRRAGARRAPRRGRRGRAARSRAPRRAPPMPLSAISTATPRPPLRDTRTRRRGRVARISRRSRAPRRRRSTPRARPARAAARRSS